jgi:hypothetical protein
MVGYTRAVSGQRLGVHVPATIEDLCFLCGLRRDIYKQGTRLMSVDIQFCTGAYEERTWMRQAEESQLLEDVARERLVKTHQVGEGSACSDFLSVEIVIVL